MNLMRSFPPHPGSGTNWGLEHIVNELREVRRNWRESCARNHECGGRELPALEPIRQIVAGLRGALFPMRLALPFTHNFCTLSYSVPA